MIELKRAAHPSPAPRRRRHAAGSTLSAGLWSPRRRKFRPTSAEKSPASNVTFHARDSISGSTSSDQSLKRRPPQASLTLRRRLGRRPCNSRRARTSARCPVFFPLPLKFQVGIASVRWIFSSPRENDENEPATERTAVTCDLRAASIFYVDKVVSASG